MFSHLGGKKKQPILCLLPTERSLSPFSNHTNPTHRHQDQLNSYLWWMLWSHNSSILEDWDTRSSSCGYSWQLNALNWVPLAQGHITAQRKLTLNDWWMVETAKAWLPCPNSRQLWMAISAPRLLNERPFATTSQLSNSLCPLIFRRGFPRGTDSQYISCMYTST